MSEDTSIIDEVVNRARIAQQHYEEIGSQQLFDDACCAVGWALMEPERNRMLAELAVQETGLGNAADKVRKNHNKTLGLLRDLKGVASIGHIRDDDEKGLSLYYRPKGVIAAIVPSTNPLATPVNNIINALKSGNAIIIAPSPKGMKPALALLEHIHQNMAKLGISEDLVQLVPSPPSKAKTERLMQLCDMVVVTGSQNNVRAGYKSGTPAIGVGAGNVVTIIDETADIAIAAENTRISKTSDFGSGCSADGNIIIQKSIYDDMVKALIAEGGYLCSDEEKHMLREAMWDEKGNRTFPTIACRPQQTTEVAGFSIPEDRKFLMVENQDQIGKEHKFSGEKLTTLMALYHFDQFEDALDTVRAIYKVGGTGHSCGIYSHNDAHIDALARVAPVSRMMVRQAQSKANAGAWTNGMPMTSSLGCGIWGGNITNENVTMKHMMNYTWVSRPIPEDRPSEQELFGEFFGQEIA